MKRETLYGSCSSCLCNRRESCNILDVTVIEVHCSPKMEYDGIEETRLMGLIIDKED